MTNWTPNFILGARSLPSFTGLSVSEQLAGLAGLMGVRRYAFFASDGQALFLETADGETLAGLAGEVSIPLTNGLYTLLAKGGTGRSWAEVWQQVAEAERPPWLPFTWAELLVPLHVAEADIFALLALGQRDATYSAFDVELIQVAAAKIVLLDSHSAMRNLARAMLVKNDLHRRGTANSLHDTLLQLMFVIKANLQALRQALPGKEGGLAVDAIARLLQAAVDEIRDLIQAQQPVILERGLAFGLESLTETLRADGAPISFETAIAAAELPVLSVEQTLGLFKIAEEALSNAARHSGAGMITVRLARQVGALELSIQDNGRGFSQPFKADRAGVAWMRERAHILQARFAIETAPGAGTRVVVRLPLEEEA